MNILTNFNISKFLSNLFLQPYLWINFLQLLYQSCKTSSLKEGSNVLQTNKLLDLFINSSVPIMLGVSFEPSFAVQKKCKQHIPIRIFFLKAILSYGRSESAHRDFSRYFSKDGLDRYDSYIINNILGNWQSVAVLSCIFVNIIIVL